MDTALEIFRTGNHRAMNGQTLDFSEATVREIVDGYDPDLHEAPLVIGHPETNGPAYGWVAGLDYADGTVLAEPHQVEAQFADLVNEGRYKKMSASFFTPTHANNPTPGKYYLRHVGFLGAQAPAVKGLKSASFADDDDTVTIEFGEGSYRDGMIARALRGLRELIIEQFGTDAADKAIPAWQLDTIAESAATEQAKEQASPAAFSDPAPNEPEPEDQETPEMDPNQNNEQTAERQAELDAREAALEAKAAEFADRERQAAHDANELFIDGLISEGKLAPGKKTELLGFMDNLVGQDAVSFADGSDAKAPLDFFKELIGSGNQVVDLSEHSAPDEDTVAVSADFAVGEGDEVDSSRMDLHARILAHAAKNGISYNEAFSQIA